MRAGALVQRAVALTCGLALVAGSAVAAATAASGAAVAAAGPTEPNIVMILTDDQPKGMMDAMPTVQAELAAKGTTYSNAIVPTSLCCPSRTSLLTGLYSSQSGVYGNFGPTQGGYDVFKLNGNEQRTLAAKMRDTEYSTGLFGKVMNGFNPQAGDPRPLGWDRMVAAVSIGDHYNYTASSDASVQPLEADQNAPQQIKRESQYSTPFFGERVTDFIRDVPADKPLFALYTPLAPHSPYQYEAKYANSGLSKSILKRDRALYEKDVSDKPFYVSYVKKWKKGKRKKWLKAWVNQTKMLRSVDDQIAEIIDTLRQEDRLDNTILIFTSDNGYHHGQQRLAFKNTPYPAATDVDLIVRMPNGPRGVVDNRLVTANIDVSATILKAADLPNSTSGVPLGNPINRSGVPLMASRERIERGLGRPAYCGFRTDTAAFIRYASGEEEYYDLSKDPAMMENVRWKKNYKARVSQLTELARDACQTVSFDYGTSFDRPFAGVAKNKKQAKKRTLDAARGKKNPNVKDKKNPNVKDKKKDKKNLTPSPRAG
jgi:N-acetylglucosamine-6-sulfatase